ncbi:MAG: hypothetical protein EBW28_05840 [Actinobacteria bacterium]|nr:hypothetical protein [Actinomycetota bacterium]
MKSAIKYSTEVSAAIAARTPIVALESTIISHGLPRPSNLLVAQECESIIRSRGAVPATIALLDGIVHIGLEASELNAIANRDDISKASSRDLAIIIAQGKSAATTVAATAHIAAIAGIKVFATGGLGGVHRGANESFDESADLTALSQLDMQMDKVRHDEILATGMANAARDGIDGKYVTPYLLEHFHTASKGESLAINTEIIKSNCALAADIAMALK